MDATPRRCCLLGVPGPRDVEGEVVYEALVDPDRYLRYRDRRPTERGAPQ